MSDYLGGEGFLSKEKDLPSSPLGVWGKSARTMTVVEYGDDLIIIDAGVMFPENEMLGIDYVIPDMTYIRENKDRVRAILLTHGHEDHIGGVPYLLNEVNAPIYGTRLTLGLLKGKLEEHGLLRTAQVHCIKAGDKIQLNSMTVEFIHVNHSIADVVALAIHTEAEL